LAELLNQGVPVVVLSTEQNSVVKARCRKLGIECLQGVNDKKIALEKWALENNAKLKDLIFVGNDVNDIACLKSVGCPIVVADAYPGVLPLALIVLQSRGGDGALRELAELIKNKGTEHV
jgi:N-acylneuraminate cytidylyltransferase